MCVAALPLSSYLPHSREHDGLLSGDAVGREDEGRQHGDKRGGEEGRELASSEARGEQRDLPGHAKPCHAMPCHAMPCRDGQDERQGIDKRDCDESGRLQQIPAG